MAAKRVLFILPNLRGGGAERVTLTLMRELCMRGYSLTLFLFKSEGVYWDEVPERVKIKTVLPAGERTSRHLTKVFLALLSEVRSHDLVVAGLEGGPTILGYLTTKLAGKPAIAWVHIALDQLKSSNWGRLMQISSRFIYSRIAAVVCVSEGSLESLRRFVGGQRNSWRTIPNPLQAMPVKNVIDVRKPGLPMVLAIGRLDNRQKGFDLLIHAHAQLRREGLNHQLTILGDGPDYADLEDLIREEEVIDSVTLPGFVHDVWTWYDQATVFVLSSRFEGLPTVLLEALARGIPVVATDCNSGPCEILKDGEYGELVASESAEALVSGLRKVLTDTAYRNLLAENGPIRAADFCPEKIVDQWEELFKEMSP